MVYMISYDLHNDKDYDSLISAIKSYPVKCHVLKSTWIIGTRNKLTAVQDKLLKAVDNDDDLLITEMVDYGGQLSPKHWPAIENIFKGYGGQ